MGLFSSTKGKKTSHRFGRGDIMKQMLQDELNADARAAAATGPTAAEESELVVAGDVVAEVMEREAPVESPAEEPRGWFSWLLGPRRESGAETNADASKPKLVQQAAGEAIGSLEFIGLWKENAKKYKRLMPIKIQAVLYYSPSCGRDNNHLRVRAALSKLVDELVRNKMSSGILTISSWEETFGDGGGSVTVWGISWSASPNDKSYQQLGLSSMLPDQNENIRFADFDGAIRSLGYEGENAKYHWAENKDRPSNIAVYRVTLPSGGLDRSKWAGRPPPPAHDHERPPDEWLRRWHVVSRSWLRRRRRCLREEDRLAAVYRNKT